MEHTYTHTYILRSVSVSVGQEVRKGTMKKSEKCHNERWVRDEKESNRVYACES